jgi:hypothetical protein
VMHVFRLGAVCFHDQCPEGDLKGARMLLECLRPFNRYFTGPLSGPMLRPQILLSTHLL